MLLWQGFPSQMTHGPHLTLVGVLMGHIFFSAHAWNKEKLYLMLFPIVSIKRQHSQHCQTQMTNFFLLPLEITGHRKQLSGPCVRDFLFCGVSVCYACLYLETLEAAKVVWGGKLANTSLSMTWIVIFASFLLLYKVEHEKHNINILYYLKDMQQQFLYSYFIFFAMIISQHGKHTTQDTYNIIIFATTQFMRCSSLGVLVSLLFFSLQQ